MESAISNINISEFKKLIKPNELLNEYKITDEILEFVLHP
tara:strand:- start:4761 stop:4880 length:120 start_codon:yes stop_codon:yes gene_type:complete